MPKILCLDYDGTCSSYASGWCGVDVCPDPPVDGLWPFLEAVSAQFQICIVSARSSEQVGRQAMRAWFAREGRLAGYYTAIEGRDGQRCVAFWSRRSFLEDPELPPLFTLYFPEHKPSAFVTLDDRALQFTGTWPTVEALLMFQPWHRTPKETPHA